MTDGQPPTAVDPAAVSTIVGSVYPAMLSEPTSVRDRAQTAYTIASAIAAGLVTAGALAGITEFGWLVQVLGIVAVGLWLLTAALFINISRRVRKIPKGEPGQLLTVNEFVSRALNVATEEADALEGQLRNAAYSTYAALAFTVLALIAALVAPPSPEQPVTSVTLSAEGTAAIATLCPGHGPVVRGELHTDTLDDLFAVIDVKNECGPGTVTLRIPPQQILATSG
jgi:MFS family permease